MTKIAATRLIRPLATPKPWPISSVPLLLAMRRHVHQTQRSPTRETVALVCGREVARALDEGMTLFLQRVMWGNVLPRVEGRQERLLAALSELAQRLGHTPSIPEAVDDLTTPLPLLYRRLFLTFENATQHVTLPAGLQGDPRHALAALERPVRRALQFAGFPFTHPVQRVLVRMSQAQQAGHDGQLHIRRRQWEDFLSHDPRAVEIAIATLRTIDPRLPVHPSPVRIVYHGQSSHGLRCTVETDPSRWDASNEDLEFAWDESHGGYFLSAVRGAVVKSLAWAWIRGHGVTSQGAVETRFVERLVGRSAKQPSSGSPGWEELATYFAPDPYHSLDRLYSIARQLDPRLSSRERAVRLAFNPKKLWLALTPDRAPMLDETATAAVVFEQWAPGRLRLASWHGADGLRFATLFLGRSPSESAAVESARLMRPFTPGQFPDISIAQWTALVTAPDFEARFLRHLDLVSLYTPGGERRPARARCRGRISNGGIVGLRLDPGPTDDAVDAADVLAVFRRVDDDEYTVEVPPFPLAAQCVPIVRPLLERAATRNLHSVAGQDTERVTSRLQAMDIVVRDRVEDSFLRRLLGIGAARGGRISIGEMEAYLQQPQAVDRLLFLAGHFDHRLPGSEGSAVIVSFGYSSWWNSTFGITVAPLDPRRGWDSDWVRVELVFVWHDGAWRLRLSHGNCHFRWAPLLPEGPAARIPPASWVGVKRQIMPPWKELRSTLKDPQRRRWLAEMVWEHEHPGAPLPSRWLLTASSTGKDDACPTRMLRVFDYTPWEQRKPIPCLAWLAFVQEGDRDRLIRAEGRGAEDLAVAVLAGDNIPIEHPLERMMMASVILTGRKSWRSERLTIAGVDTYFQRWGSDAIVRLVHFANRLRPELSAAPQRVAIVSYVATDKNRPQILSGTRLLYDAEIDPLTPSQRQGLRLMRIFERQPDGTYRLEYDKCPGRRSFLRSQPSEGDGDLAA